MRINRFLANSGYCSRREADRLVLAGRVHINDKLATLGDAVNDKDRVYIDSKELTPAPAAIYLMYNKPKGITCTTELSVAGNIISAVGHKERIFPVGRLDKDSTGLILLTNDGEFSQQLLRSKYNHEKEYQVQVNLPVTDQFIQKMANGVDISDPELGTVVTKKCRVWKTAAQSFTIVLTEGKNRQIRRMCAALGYEVTLLHRVRIVNILLGDLPQGKWQKIPEELLLDLLKRVK